MSGTDINKFFRKEQAIWHRILSVVSKDPAYVWTEIHKGDIERLREATIELFKTFQQKNSNLEKYQKEELQKLFLELVGKFWEENKGLLQKGKEQELREVEKYGPKNWFEKIKRDIIKINIIINSGSLIGEANDVQVAIIGGGFAGVNIAYRLAEQGITSMIIEAGKIGKGNDKFPAGSENIVVPQHTKFITTTFDSDYKTFSKMHGHQRAKTFMDLTDLGVETVKALAKKFGQDICRELDAILIVEDEKHLKKLIKEQADYKSLGYNFKLLSNQEVNNIFHADKDCFKGGMLLHKNILINQPLYLNAMLQASRKMGAVDAEGKTVINIKQTQTGVHIETHDGDSINADYAVIATNGFMIDKNLKGLLHQKWVFVQSYKDEGPNSPNAWTLNDHYFYFTRQDNILSVGGADRDAEIKNGSVAPVIDETQPMKEIKDWVNKKFPATRNKSPIATHFGVYCHTKDELPIVGKFSSESRIAYLVGCNGIGHTTFTVAAMLIPTILGYKLADDTYKKFIELLSPQRFKR